ncbi:MAG TPA: hypothetical protein VF950_00840 [Planctomycetota bacterium]
MVMALQQDVDALKKRVDELERKLSGGQEGDLPKAAQDAKRDAGEVYSKPFLARFGRNVYLGGYIDLEFIGTEDNNSDTFDQHRLVPFIYADVTKNVKVAAEIEIEHGNGTELGVEFAHVDYWMHDLINFRAGIILDPLGKFNLTHDAPFQDLTLRPLVDEAIIPAVLREPGVGFFGSLDLDPWEIEYEVYLVNGFKGLTKLGVTNISRTAGLRNARPHLGATGFGSAYRDFNDDKAVVGRVSASPFLGLEAGISAHTGMYDERGDNRLTIWAVDWTVNLGGIARAVGAPAEFFTRFEVVGETARALISRDALARTAGVPDDFDGLYVETRFHFMPDFLRAIVPGASDESTFTLVYRWDDVDLDGFKRDAHTVGVNFRPIEDTVFKFEVQFREEHGLQPDLQNDAYVFSVATYF